MQQKRELLTNDQAAEFLQLAPRTLDGLRIRGGGPPFVRVSRRAVRYRRRDLEKWLENRTFTSTTEADQALPASA